MTDAATVATPIGVLLAAGRGRRLGGGKLLMPWPPDGDAPMVAHAAAVLARVCPRIVVVLGDRADAVEAAVGDAVDGLDAVGASGARARANASAAANADASGLAPTRTDLEFVLADPDAPMFASIRAGLAASRRRDATASVVLQPGDVPDTAPATVDVVLRHAADGAGDRAVMPEHAGKGGHPVVIPPAVRDLVLELDDAFDGGLRAFWEARPELARRIAVADAGASRDVDRPADYARGRRDPEASSCAE